MCADLPRRRVARIRLEPAEPVPFGAGPIHRLVAQQRPVIAVSIAHEKEVVGEQHAAGAFEADLEHTGAFDGLGTAVGEQAPGHGGRQRGCGAVFLAVKPLVDQIIDVPAEITAVPQRNALIEDVGREDGLDGAPVAVGFRDFDDVQSHRAADVRIVVLSQGHIALAQHLGRIQEPGIGNEGQSRTQPALGAGGVRNEQGPALGIELVLVILLDHVGFEAEVVSSPVCVASGVAAQDLRVSADFVETFDRLLPYGERGDKLGQFLFLGRGQEIGFQHINRRRSSRKRVVPQGLVVKEPFDS